MKEKGYEIEEKATAVLTPEMVALVTEAFETDLKKAKRLRQEAEEATVQEEVLVGSVAAQAAETVTEERAEASATASPPEPSPPVEQEEVPQPATESTPSPAPSEEATETLVGPKIIGKIDLEALEPKPKKKKTSSTKEVRSKGKRAGRKKGRKQKPQVVEEEHKQVVSAPSEKQEAPVEAKEGTAEELVAETPATTAPPAEQTPETKPVETTDLETALTIADSIKLQPAEGFGEDIVLTAPQGAVAPSEEGDEAPTAGAEDTTSPEEQAEDEPESGIPTFRILGHIDLDEWDTGERGQRKGRKKRAEKGVKQRRAKEEEPEPETETLEASEVSPQDALAEASPPVRFRKRRKKSKQQVDQADVERTLKKTLQAMSGGETALEERRRQRKLRKQQRKQEELQRQEELQQLEKVVEIPEFITVAELANVLGVTPNQIIVKCMELGVIVSINQRLDRDIISLIAEDMGFEVRFVEEPLEDALTEDEEDRPEDLQPRPPVVTIMGHVDHGKTSLLDYIRQSNVVAGEAGGITQHIGAYKVTLPDDPNKAITFLDTPGHEAFTAMRARGAQVTDIVVLVVAADDRVMPQTEEAISHAQVAGVPIIVAINKIDKPEANPDLIKQQLAEKGLLVEEWGGDVPCVEVSAKTGQGVDQLLETILVVAELQDLKANPRKKARGTVIEAKLDRGKGPVATVLVQQGTLHEGDIFVCGSTFGRVRAMLDERGHRVKEATPATPVQVLGFNEVPEAGDSFVVVDTESKAREIARQRQILKREKLLHRRRQMSLENLSSLIQEHAVKELPIVLKADVVGSLEALTEALYKLSTPEVAVNVIHKGIGAISESDVMLAAASNAIVIGFHVRPTSAAKQAAEREGVEIRIYRVIYECVDDVKKALQGMLQPEQREEVVGIAEVREIFRIRKVGTVAGCYVQEGVIHRNDTVRVIRDGIEIFEGKIRSLRRHKDDVREVKAGYECGILLESFNDIQVGDIIEAVQIVEVQRVLETTTS